MSVFLPRGIRTVLSAAALTAVAVVAAGCASQPAVQPASPPLDETTEPATSHVHTSVDPGHIDASWINGGDALAIITWGSSTRACQPGEIEATADGQTISLVMKNRPEADAGCDADLVARGNMVMVPDGVDRELPVTVNVNYESVSTQIALEPLQDVPSAGEFEPSAGWFGDDGIVLVTYGSSSCPPHVKNVQVTDDGATVTFEAPGSGGCTMDLAPRLTPIVLPQPVSHEDFTLTLVGDLLDGEVAVVS